MNLVIDVGNTSVKTAIFDQYEIVETRRFFISDFSENIKTLTNKFPKLRKAIVSSVGILSERSLDILKGNIDIITLTSTTKVPFQNKYKSPQTLGVDRIALVMAAYKNYPDTNVLIIDAGTCITYDFLDHRNNYLGGAISPGLRLRYESLHNFTAKLPLLKRNHATDILGTNTIESIHSGVVLGAVMEIDGAIEKYKNNFSDLTVILTGGDCKFLSNQLKNSIFANSNFLFEGLNHILEYNSH